MKLIMLYVTATLLGPNGEAVKTQEFEFEAKPALSCDAAKDERLMAAVRYIRKRFGSPDNQPVTLDITCGVVLGPSEIG